MAGSVYKPDWFETPGYQGVDVENDGSDDLAAAAGYRRWGMGLVTALTLAGFSTLAVVTAIGWSFAGN